jgi:hypothetical protein
MARQPTRRRLTRAVRRAPLRNCQTNARWMHLHTSETRQKSVSYVMHVIDRDNASHNQNNKSKRARKFRARTLFRARTFRANMS